MSTETHLLCIGAGEEQISAIYLAQQLGYAVLAVDGNPNAPGLKIANKSYVVDLKNQKKVIEIAQANSIAGIIPVPLGSILTTVGAVNDALGTHGISLNTAQLCTDKMKMRETFDKHGLSQPRFSLATSLNMLKEVIDNFSLPAIIKPRYGSGSHEVFLLEDHQDVEKFSNKIQDFVHSDYLVESCLEGQEYGVDGVVYNGICEILFIRRKAITPPPFRVALSYVGSQVTQENVNFKIYSSIAKAATALQLKDCLFHADIMLDTTGEVSIIEMSGRPSGFGLSMELLPICLGFHPVEQMINVILGKKYSFEPRRSLVGIVRGLTTHSGRVHSIGNIDAARLIPGVINIRLGITEGDFIEPIKSGSDWWRIGQAMIVGESESQVESTWRKVQKTLDLIVK